MSGVFCTDCASECERVDGAGIRPDLAGSAVWRCPDCPDSWARHIEATGGPGEPPSGPETKAARVLLQRERIEHLLEQAVRLEPGTRTIAQGRIVFWLAKQLGMADEHAALGFMGIDQLRRAWGILGRASYRQILEAARNKQPRSTRRPSQPEHRP